MTRHIIRANFDIALGTWNFLIYDDVVHKMVYRSIIGSEMPTYSMNVGFGGPVET